jgi:threonine/homoserine/homoserine lactone efflux protein
MTDPVAFLLAVLALLATPGPTNTLLAASGASAGLRASLRLIPAELAGYLSAILPLVLLAGPAVAAHPGAATALKAAAALWLAISAVRLWREAGAGFATTPRPVSPARVFVTTLLNPKALVFALVVFPHDGGLPLAAATAGFAVMVVGIASSWIALGSVIAGAGGERITPRLVTRTAALALAVFATLVAGSAVAGVL